MEPRTYIELRVSEGGRRKYYRKLCYNMDAADVLHVLQKYLPAMLLIKRRPRERRTRRPNNNQS